jgi:hypothetical protein
LIVIEFDRPDLHNKQNSKNKIKSSQITTQTTEQTNNNTSQHITTKDSIGRHKVYFAKQDKSSASELNKLQSRNRQN